MQNPTSFCILHPCTTKKFKKENFTLPSLLNIIRTRGWGGGEDACTDMCVCRLGDTSGMEALDYKLPLATRFSGPALQVPQVTPPTDDLETPHP